MGEVREFVARQPKTEPVPFAITALRIVDGGAHVEERATFSATPALSFGRLLGELVDSDGDVDSALTFFEQALVRDNTCPDGEDDTRTEFERFRDFLTDPDLYIDKETVQDIAEWLSEQTAGRPTRPQSGSRSTPSSGQRGSAAKRRKRA